MFIDRSFPAVDLLVTFTLACAVASAIPLAKDGKPVAAIASKA